ncbi:MAG: hypothetical protein ACRCX7_11345 [Cetobacterium sp.]|uniref:hypothetical protein n=1 Tax=Cetobacterium sp. TaxID=2071632 RepID=UPI003F3099B5
MRDYEVFEEFYKNAYQIIRRACAYSGLNHEEVKQECAIVYFENPLIAEQFSEGNNKSALRLLMVGLRQSLKDFYDFGTHVDRNSVYESGLAGLQRIHDNTDEAVGIENEIMNKLEIERLKKKFGEEYIDDIIEYYDFGSDSYCKKHGITNETARKRISRKIQKLRHEEA